MRFGNGRDGKIRGDPIESRIFAVLCCLRLPRPPAVASKADQAGAQKKDGGGFGDLLS